MQAQYTIPGATQQPAWVFPLWFENAFGQKDTVYIGYDSNASIGFFGGWDTIYGEKLIKIDTSIFNMSLCSYILNNDSVYKTMVTSDLTASLGCDGTFYIYGASNAWLPLIMRWDVNLFRSDSLPFPNQSPASRAQAHVFFQGDASEPGSFCMSPGDPLLVTDSVNIFGSGFAQCVRKDSVIFTQLSNLYIEIHPWEGRITTGVSVKENQKPPFQVQVFPNPFSSSATIKISADEQKISNYQLVVYDIFGKVVLKSEISNQQTEINRGNLSKGLYFYEITNQKNQPVKGKFIIQ